MLTCLVSLGALGVFFCSHRLFSIPLVLRLLTTSHLLAPAGSITISLDWLLLLLLARWWNWKDDFSSACVCPLGRSRTLGHQLGCCRGFVEEETTPPPPPHLLFSLEWCHSLGESDCYCQGDLCVHSASQTVLHKARSEGNSQLMPYQWDLSYEMAGMIHFFYVTT